MTDERKAINEEKRQRIAEALSTKEGQYKWGLLMQEAQRMRQEDREKVAAKAAIVVGEDEE